MPTLTKDGRRLNGRGSGWITPVKRLAIYLRDGFLCVYCKRDLHDADPCELTLDHVVPRSRGGSNEHTNLVTACLNCNSRRQKQPVAAFVRYITCERVGLNRETRHLQLRWRTYHEVKYETMQHIRRVRRLSLARYLVLAKDIITTRKQRVGEDR